MDSVQMIKPLNFSSLSNWSVQYLLESRFSYKDNFELLPIGSFLIKSRSKIFIEDEKKYQRVTVKINNNGVFPRDIEIGKNIGTKQQYQIKTGQFLMSKIDARNGAFGLVPKNLDGAIVTNDFPVFDVNNSVINPEFLVLITTTKEFVNFAQSCSSGTTNRQRINIDLFLNVKIPLPSLSDQNKIVEAYNKRIEEAENQERKARELQEGIESYLFEALGIKKEKTVGRIMFQILNYSDLDRWDAKYKNEITSSYKIYTIRELIQEISTGATPPTSRQEYFANGDIEFYTPSDLGNSKDLINAERKISEKALLEKKSRRFNKGTLLFVGIGSTIGKVGIVKNEFAASNQQITGLVFGNNVDIDFIYYYFDLCKHITTSEKTQATIPIVNQDKILSIPVPVPPIEIQHEIANTISKMRFELKSLEKKAAINREQAIKEFEQEIFEI